MRTTPFYELAEKISERITHAWFCCVDLENDEHVKYFESIFKPTEADREEYSVIEPYQDSDSWMSVRYVDAEFNNNFRILALLLCHEIYLSETK